MGEDQKREIRKKKKLSGAKETGWYRKEKDQERRIRKKQEEQQKAEAPVSLWGMVKSPLVRLGTAVKSSFTRLGSAIKNSRFGKFVASAGQKIANSRFGKFITSTGQKIANSSLYKVLGGRAFGYATGIASAIVAAVVAPQAAIAIAVIAVATTVGFTALRLVKSARDTKNIEKLVKNDQLAKDLNKYLSKQMQLGLIDKDLLHVLASTGDSQKVEITAKKPKTLLKKIKTAIFDSTEITQNIMQLGANIASLNPVAIASATSALLSDVLEDRNVNATREALEKQIDEAVKKAGIFQNISSKSLEKLVNIEKRKTEALVELIQDKGGSVDGNKKPYFAMNVEEKTDRFKKNLEKLQMQEPQVAPKNSLWRNMVNAINPFYKVREGNINTDVIKSTKYDNLTNALTKNLQIELELEKIKNDMSESSLSNKKQNDLSQENRMTKSSIQRSKSI